MREIGLFLCLLFLAACGGQKSTEKAFLSDNISFAQAQIGKEIEHIEGALKVLNPITLKKDGSVYYGSYSDWRSGFFPGTVWYLYELTEDQNLLPLAHKYSEAIEEAKNLSYHHDVGFIIECSFGNGLRLTGKKEYEGVIVEAAKSLSTRFREKPEVIQSWNVDRGWQAERGWMCPVIIDNMMNLELLFHATKITGDRSFYQTAVSHADRTLQEQFREDGSCYHVIDYDLESGEVRNRHTAQGYAHESAWSRGQAWAIYGYTVCYRETGDRKYLDMAIKAFDFMKNHPDMPEDLIPYWDMDAPEIPNALRDVSAASCIASALYELSTMDVENPTSFKAYADQIMTSLASPAYRAELGENGNFLLKHSVGSIPHNAEIDVPLNYADYYFMEALKRKRDIESK